MNKLSEAAKILKIHLLTRDWFDFGVLLRKGKSEKIWIPVAEFFGWTVQQHQITKKKWSRVP